MKKTISEVYVLATGERVRFRLKKRSRDTNYFVCFRDRGLKGCKGRPRELSTGQPNVKRAKAVALSIIDRAFGVNATDATSVVCTWEEALEKMEEAMIAENLRPATIYSYKIMIGNLRALFPESKGPSDICDVDAKRFKIARSKVVEPRTVGGNLNKLSCVWSKWFKDECGIVNNNPFEDVEKPKVDKPEKRILRAEESDILHAWINERWDGWRMPILFLETKASIGCRVRELAYLRPHQLEDGRVVIESASCKGRKTRKSKLTPSLYGELAKISGQNFVFEHWSRELRELHARAGRSRYSKQVKGFDPEHMVRWVQKQVANFRKAHPNIKYFKLHNYRGTAMSKAKASGVSYDDAAIAFGCHPETMRQFYVALDETAISDDVMDRIQAIGPPTARA